MNDFDDYSDLVRPTREQQILELAARGMTDKEIGSRLGISVDTVGTYWRRAFARHGASSRTEVVAQFTEHRSRRVIERLSDLNKCLEEMVDHLLEDWEPPAASAWPAGMILSNLPDWVLTVDRTGKISMSNRPIDAPEPHLKDIVDKDDLAALHDAVQSAIDSGTQGKVLALMGGQTYDCRVTAFSEGSTGIAIVSARS